VRPPHRLQLELHVTDVAYSPGQRLDLTPPPLQPSPPSPPPPSKLKVGEVSLEEGSCPRRTKVHARQPRDEAYAFAGQCSGTRHGRVLLPSARDEPSRPPSASGSAPPCP